MKYKTKKILDEMEDDNSYIEVDNSTNTNQAKIVESATDKETSGQASSTDLTITSAMEKYFYPKFEELTKYEQRIKDVYNKINKSLPDKPKRKHVARRVVLESLLSLGLGCVIGFVYAILTNSFVVGPIIMVGGVSTMVLGAVVGIIDNMAYKISSKRKKDLNLSLNNKLVGIIVEDKKHIDSFVQHINKFKSQIDLNKQTAIDDMSKIQVSVAMFNQEIYNAIERIYDITQNKTLLELVGKYKNIENCYKDMNQILEDFNTLKKILPTLQVYAPQIIDMDNTNVIYSFRNDEAKLLIKTMIPFAQVLNITYDKVYENYLEDRRIEEEKVRQEKLRQQEEERLRKEIEQREFEKENKKYKQFFDSFGIDAELDQEEITK